MSHVQNTPPVEGFVRYWYNEALRRWRQTEAVIMSAWVEICWGAWMLTNPTFGTPKVLHDIGGEWLGIAFIVQGLLRWACMWSARCYPVRLIISGISVFGFALLVWAAAEDQGVFSGLVLMYLGFFAVQLYIFTYYTAVSGMIERNKPRSKQ